MSTTPMMKQFWEIKSAHKDKILLYRMGDFYEMFYDDAVQAAPVIGIALTSRNKKSAEETPMCGVPHHSIAGPINKLLAAGLKVAICDQLEDPKTAKGIVKRGVTRVLTPGMVYDPDTLEKSQNHFLCSYDESSVSFLDLTTAEAFYFDVSNNTDIEKIAALFPIAELVLNEEQVVLPSLLLKPLSRWADGNTSSTRLKSYVLKHSTADQSLILKDFEKREVNDRMMLSPTSIRHLEIFQTYKGEEAGSLYHAISRVKTSAGARLLKNWLVLPLSNKKQITERQDKIENWITKAPELKKLREILGQMGDLERRLSKIATPQVTARDLQSLCQSIQTGISALQLAKHNISSFKSLFDWAKKIEVQIVEEAPLSTKQGGLFNKGIDPVLDEWIDLSTNAQNLVLDLEKKEKELTGITSLKIRYNQVFGFYIEVTNTHKDKVPERYARKQTLANAERYYTDELIELERKVLSAQVKRNELESEKFEALRREILSQSVNVMQLSFLCAELDVVSALAWLAIERNYARPKFISKGFKLSGSRHPVVEQFVDSKFISNDLELTDKNCLLLTGPNMAGKSTLMRQVALTALLAQIGSYVPAASADLALFDRIETRIGSSDQLSEGLSTFMVEMTETADILKSASQNSLLIFDEVGRGTSTFDGMSLAQALLEFLLTQVKATTLFATHYHELTSLEEKFPTLTNGHLTVADKNGELKFLYTLVKGSAQKSYGIKVAELAGLPKALVTRAQKILSDIEKAPKKTTSDQMSLLDFTSTVEVTTHPVIEEIKKFELQKKTPLDALNKIAEWQNSIN